MNIFLDEKITPSSIYRIIIAYQSKDGPFLFTGIFGTIYKTKNGTTIPIPEAMNFFYAGRFLLQNVRYFICHIIADAAIISSDMKMQISVSRNCCMFITNDSNKVL